MLIITLDQDIMLLHSISTQNIEKINELVRVVKFDGLAECAIDYVTNIVKQIELTIINHIIINHMIRTYLAEL